MLISGISYLPFMTLLIVVAAIALLIVLISWAKFNTFLAFLIVSILAGICLGIPPESIAQSEQKGIGDVLGSLVVIIVLVAIVGEMYVVGGEAHNSVNY